MDTMERIGALNQAPCYPGLTPGDRQLGITVTEDHRVLLLRSTGKNYLLFPTSDGDIWYEFRVEKVTKIGEDYPIRKKSDQDWNSLPGLFDETPDIGECWEVDFGGFSRKFRSETLAQEAATRHKSRFGGIGGEYEPSGWYPIRRITEEEWGVIERNREENK